MDNWFTIVLAFIFFVLPLLEGVLKKRRGQGDELPPDTDYPELPTHGRRENTLPGESGGSADSRWSEEWGSWPGDVEPEEEEAEQVPAWSTPNQPDRYAVDARADLPGVPEEVSSATPDLVAQTEIGRSLEPPRMPELARRLDLVAQAETSPKPVAPSIIVRPKAAAGVQRPARVARLLGDRASVRRAIIVSEVLGAPLATRGRPGD